MDEPNMDWTGLIAERKIQEAIEAGEFDNLPGKGQPLDLTDDPFTPPHLRAVNRVLKNARTLPQWIQLEKDLERELALLEPKKRRALTAISRATNRSSAERIAYRLRGDYRDRLSLLNTMALHHKFSAPASRTQQRDFRIYNVKREMEWLESEIAQAMKGDV